MTNATATRLQTISRSCLVIAASLGFLSPLALGQDPASAGHPPPPSATPSPAAPPAAAAVSFAPSAPNVVEGPQICLLGVYILGLRDLNSAEGTFTVDFWVWSQSTAPDNILANLQFLNAQRITIHSENIVESGGVRWAKRRATATMRQQWDMSHYPFDRQSLKMDLLYTGRDARHVIIRPDTANSGLADGVHITDWKVTGFSINTRPAVYSSNLGDPGQTTGESEYSGLIAKIDVDRAEVNGYWKLLSSLIVGFIIMLVSFFLEPDAPGPRYGMLGGAMFAAVLSWRSVAPTLGANGTVADTIHYVGMGIMIVAILATFLLSSLARRGVPSRQLRYASYLFALVSLVTFASISAVLLSQVKS